MTIAMKARAALLVGLAAAAGCGKTLPTARETLTESLDQTGVTPRTRQVESGALLQFVNTDVRPHEIYSSDCRELASTPLAAGQAVYVRLAPGPKLCHFQDLLAPMASEYWGTVSVSEPEPPLAEITGG